MQINTEGADTSSHNNSKRTKYVLMVAAVAFVLTAVFFTAVPEESSGYNGFDTIGEGDTGVFSRQWTSGDCTVDYGGTWTYHDQKFHYSGTMVISGNGAMEDYSEIRGSLYPSTPWLEASDASSPIYAAYEVIIKEGVTHIGAYSFFNMKMDPVIPLPSTLKSIGAHAFEKAGITSLEIPESVTEIGEYAFRGTNLDSVKIPDNVKEIKEWTFGESGLRSVEIPKSLAYIGNSAFQSCAIESIDLPDSLTDIGESAFSNCWNLKSVVIPDGVKVIRWCAFDSCGNLSDITFGPDLRAIEHGAFRATGLQSFILPPGVNLGTSVFEYCGSLQYVYLPDTITEITSDLFKGCVNLKSVVIPDSVTTIQMTAFNGCHLEYLSIPSSVKFIGPGAFTGASIKHLVVPGTLDKIDFMAFYAIRCDYITIEDGINDLGAWSFMFGTGTKTVFNIPKDPSNFDSSSIFNVSKFYDVDRTTELPATYEALAGHTFVFNDEGNKRIAYKIDVNEPETIKYTWLNYDGTVLQTQELPRGELPTYELDFPVNKFGLTFCGWDSIADKYGHVIYMAMYQPGELTDIGGDDGMSDSLPGDESSAESSDGGMLPLAVVAVIAVVGIVAAVVFIRSR